MVVDAEAGVVREVETRNPDEIGGDKGKGAERGEGGRTEMVGDAETGVVREVEGERHEEGSKREGKENEGGRGEIDKKEKKCEDCD